MYPYRGRTAWLVNGRYAHLVHALDRRRGIQDSVLEARIEAMRFWSRIRAVVIALLSIGVAATATAWAIRFLPSVETAVDAIERVARTTGALSGLLTLVYLFLNRLLGQIEADILTILTLDHGRGA